MLVKTNIESIKVANIEVSGIANTLSQILF